MLEHLGTQKHEHMIGELELKHHKLKNKMIEKQHQCECKHEQHEFCMMQMQMMMSQNQQAALIMMWSQHQPSFEGFRLMAELSDATLPLVSLYPI
jgi:hypothetical protein